MRVNAAHCRRHYLERTNSLPPPIAPRPRSHCRSRNCALTAQFRTSTRNSPPLVMRVNTTHRCSHYFICASPPPPSTALHRRFHRCARNRAPAVRFSHFQPPLPLNFFYYFFLLSYIYSLNNICSGIPTEYLLAL